MVANNLAMNSPNRHIPSPPEPVDVNNSQWVARAWQWTFDRLIHLDECLDEAKDSQRDMQAALTASITAGKDGDKTLNQLISEHLDFHKLMDTTQSARKSVWRGQGAAVSNAIRVITDLIGLGGGVLLLKALGVHL